MSTTPTDRTNRQNHVFIPFIISWHPNYKMYLYISSIRINTQTTTYFVLWVELIFSQSTMFVLYNTTNNNYALFHFKNIVPFSFTTKVSFLDNKHMSDRCYCVSIPSLNHAWHFKNKLPQKRIYIQFISTRCRSPSKNQWDENPKLHSKPPKSEWIGRFSFFSYHWHAMLNHKWV